MERPSSTVRRRAWVNSSRQWPTLEGSDPDGRPCDPPSASIADDDVFSEGYLTGKIEDWLLGCGSEVRAVNTGPPCLELVLKANLDDDLTLGADALEVNGRETASEAGHPSAQQGPSGVPCSTPRRKVCLPSLNLGHSMASSCMTSSTCKTTSTVSEVLQLCAEDPEETLYELGFGCDEPQVTVRIPPRFFNFPSLVNGINFRLFLDSQLRRIREEDPSLSLASRFRQVQVLTAMANAFYSLYSHVSRTPVQKLAPPEFTFSPSSPADRFERHHSSVRSEPRSPVERLKDTVSKMCLYRGSSPRGSGSTSPQPSPGKRASLPDVVDIVLGKAKSGASKRLDLGEHNRSSSAVDVRIVTDDAEVGKDDRTDERAGADTGVLQSADEALLEETQAGKQTDGENSVEQATDFGGWTRSVRTSVASSLSGETVIEADQQRLSCQPEIELFSTQGNAGPADLKTVAKTSRDLIYPQIVESVDRVPFCTECPKTNTLKNTTGSDRSCPGSLEAHEQTEWCITVTGWEGDSASSCSSRAPDSSHASTVSPVQTRARECCDEGKTQYLNPPRARQGPGHDSSNLQQVNSFELEEVHSAGEEDAGQSETTTTNPRLSKKHTNKGEVARGDSMQSDSSGYADEDASPSSNTHSR